ncbi:MAG TPA: DJ-1/PfpI family protein [Kofleriaceae bacterium]|nr:DJ-1/PfpI family protein [Kofleriaceae bacterium]
MRKTASIALTLCAVATAAVASSAAASPASGGGAGARAGAAKPANVAILIYEGTEILDFAGPAEVLQAAGSFAGDGIHSALNVYTVARTHDPILAQGFIKVVPQYSVADAPRPDVIVIPGGQSSSVSEDEATMKWLRGAVAGAGVTTLTVCTGAFPLAQEGLLDGKEITTFYGAIQSLQKVAPKTRVKDGRRFIDNGKYITTAGVSAGIDGSLHLVARMLGRRVADQTARYMEYHWTPEPYLAVKYEYWNPSADARGRALQQANMAADEKRWDEAVAGLRRLVAQRPHDDVAWLHLGYTLGEKGDHVAAIAAFQKVAASGPQRAEVAFYIAREYAARRDEKNAVRYLTRAIAAGFSREHALHDPLLEKLRDKLPPAPAASVPSASR